MHILKTHISNDLMLHPKLTEKEEKAKSKTSRRKEIIKIRVKINEIETQNTRINETKIWFFEEIMKIDKDSTKLEMKKGISQQTPVKSRGILRITLKMYSQINWKI
jgi:hypothetical protein